MKTLFFALALALPSFAQAAVVDTFTCQAILNNANGSFNTTENLHFAVVRLPVTQGNSSDVRMTKGDTSFNFNLNDGPISLSMKIDFEYMHAVKLDAKGKVIDARQWSGGLLNFQSCDRSTGTCTRMTNPPVAPLDPFDSNNGWPQTGVNGDTPEYSSNSSLYLDQPVVNGAGVQIGRVNVQCKFDGTYD